MRVSSFDNIPSQKDGCIKSEQTSCACYLGRTSQAHSRKQTENQNGTASLAGGSLVKQRETVAQMDRWIFLVAFLRVAFCQASLKYTVHEKVANFDEANTLCSTQGSLPSMSDETEEDEIISFLTERMTANGNFRFWIGLKKYKTECVDKNLPLRGFQWTRNNSSNSTIVKWNSLSEESCTSPLCGLLSVDYNGTEMDWAFESKKCSAKHQFICSKILNQCKNPPSVEGVKFIQVPDNLNLLEVTCPLGETLSLYCNWTDQTWTLNNERVGDFTTLCPGCKPGFEQTPGGQCVDKDECKNKPCKHICYNIQGSYTCACQEGYVLSEDLTSCEKSLMGRHNAATAATRSPPRPIPSHRPSSRSTSPTTPSPGTLASPTTYRVSTPGILLPILAAVSVLVLVLILVAVILIIVKCCPRKQSKNITGKKDGKAKELVVLNTTDSVEQANEKQLD